MPSFIICADSQKAAEVVAHKLARNPHLVKPRHGSKEKSAEFCHFLNAPGIPRKYKPFEITVELRPKKKKDDDA